MRINDDIGVHAIYEACKKSIYKPKPDRLTITDLINAPLIKELRLKHWDQIEENVSDRIWALYGSAFHSILENADKEFLLKEELFSSDFEGTKITGRIDRLAEEHDKIILQDYKVTSAWSCVYGFDPTYTDALNVYAYFVNECFDYKVDKLQLIVLYRDWMKTKMMQSSDYPRQKVERHEIQLWSKDRTKAFIRERIDAHVRGQWCTDTERWKKDDVFAVMKKNRKSAVKLFDNEPEAQLRINNSSSDHYLEVREGSYRKCEDFCNVRPFCPYYEDFPG